MRLAVLINTFHLLFTVLAAPRGAPHRHVGGMHLCMCVYKADS